MRLNHVMSAFLETSVENPQKGVLGVPCSTSILRSSSFKVDYAQTFCFGTVLLNLNVFSFPGIHFTNFVVLFVPYFRNGYLFSQN